MEIREYKEEDRQSWIRCRVLAFLDSSYFDDVQNFREEYKNPAVRMVAVENGQVVGFLDCEYERQPGDICYFKGEKGGVIWHLGVLPEYRRQKTAFLLWEEAKKLLKEEGVRRVEVWTQDDEAANRWYLSQGFVFREAYLNAYMRGGPRDEKLNKIIDFRANPYIKGVRSFNFEAPMEKKEELAAICCRLHEVRVYEAMLNR